MVELSPTTVVITLNDNDLNQGLANFICNKPGSNCFRFWGPYGFCHNYSTIQLQQESSYKHVNKCDDCIPTKLYKNRWQAGFSPGTVC